jgi:triosephosphate isomerase
VPRTIVAANWKMHKTAADTAAFLDAFLAELVDTPPHVDIFIAPPFTAIQTASERLSGSRVSLGAQTMHWDLEGPFTGEISAPMLKEFGVSFVILGHSERRAACGETDAGVNRKTLAALDGVPPAAFGRLAIAYEPIWAIGTGHNCDPVEADRMMGLIRNAMPGLEDTPILYGGSMKAENVADYTAKPNINGGLVGGASLDAHGFADLVRHAR